MNQNRKNLNKYRRFWLFFPEYIVILSYKWVFDVKPFCMKLNLDVIKEKISSKSEFYKRRNII